MKNYIVLHTHWDREWYFTTSDSLVLMDRTFKNIINELELYPEINFCLDGQYSIIEEFLNINPELEKKVKNLVLENRFQIGPWHTQTDTQLVAEESIVRNLYYGMNKSQNRFGNVMKVGYLPDTFGFCHQMPEIFDVAGIDKAVFWRGADFSNGTKPYFKWQGAGGAVSKTINLYGGYGMAKGFSSDESFVNQTLKNIIANYKELGIDGELVIPVGNDQFEIKEDIPKTIKKINEEFDMDLVDSDYSNSIDAIFESNDFDTYTCEFRKTAYTRLHKSIGSVRYDLKKANYEAEQLLINEVEPLFVIGKQFGINPSINLLYSAWSLLFEGHAHDGICGCISDAVYDDMLNRIKRAKEIGNSLKNLIMKQIANKLNVKDSEVLLINTSPQSKFIHEITVYSEFKTIGIKNHDSEVVRTKIIESRDDALVETAVGNIYEHLDEMYMHKLVVECELLPYDMKILSLEQIDAELHNTENTCDITNGIITASVKENRIDVAFGDLVYNDVISLVECGNDGDTYDFSPVIDDQPIEYEICTTEAINGKLKSSLKIAMSALLPYNLNEREKKIQSVESTINLKIDLYKGDSKLHVNVEVDNNVLSHKLSVRLNTSSYVKRTVSSSAYGQIERDVTLDNDIIDWQGVNVEKPVSIETFDGFVKSVDNDFTILSTFGKEYQAHNNYIDLTVFATTGELGKSDLLNRPGRASGDVTKKGHVKIDTPKAQCLGIANFDFAITLTSNDYFECMANVQDYRTEAISYQVQDINKFEGRIDNKLMSYRDTQTKEFDYERLKLDTNGYITSIGIGLNGETIIRGVANDKHQFNTACSIGSVNLLGESRPEEFKKFSIFNYRLEG